MGSHSCHLTLDERPDYVDTRETFGEWERELMIFERAQGKMMEEKNQRTHSQKQ